MIDCTLLQPSTTDRLLFIIPISLIPSFCEFVTITLFIESSTSLHRYTATQPINANMPPSRTQRSARANTHNSVFQGILQSIANEVSLSHDGAFADSDWKFRKAVWTINRFERVDVGAIEKDDQECGICRDVYGSGLSHYPIRLSCGHIVGLICIVKWFNIITTNKRRAYPASSASIPRATCPFCRNILFQAPSTRESFFELTVRMMLWSHMYSELGIRLNKTEEDSKNDIMQLCLVWLDGIADKKELTVQVTSKEFEDLYDYLVYRVDDFTFRLKSRRLTRLQETKRAQLFGVALDWLEDFSRPVYAGYQRSKPGGEWIWQVTPTIPTIRNYPNVCLESKASKSSSHLKKEDTSA